MAISSIAATCTALIFPSITSPQPPRPSSSVAAVNQITQQRPRRKATAAVARASGAGAVLDRPTFDQSQLDTLPAAQEGGDTGRLKDRRGTGDSYKVLLVDDVRHTEKLDPTHFTNSGGAAGCAVEKALPLVVPSVTAEAARQLFRESRQKGATLVIVTVKEHAEFYAHMMVRQGLQSAIQPAADMAT